MGLPDCRFYENRQSDYRNRKTLFDALPHPTGFWKAGKILISILLEYLNNLIRACFNNFFPGKGGPEQDLIMKPSYILNE
jgi:hypothetical protein